MLMPELILLGFVYRGVQASTRKKPNLQVGSPSYRVIPYQLGGCDVVACLSRLDCALLRHVRDSVGVLAFWSGVCVCVILPVGGV